MGNDQTQTPEQQKNPPSSSFNELANIEQESSPSQASWRPKRKSKVLLASKNILIEGSKNPGQKILTNNEKQNSENIIEPCNQTEINETLGLHLSIRGSKRIKIKRPAFQMITIEYNQFIVMKKTPIKKDFELLKEIGKGSYGQVFKAKEKKSGELRAIKKIDKSKLDPEELNNLFNEFEILRKMDHPNIIKLYDIYQEKNNLYVVTQLCEGGSLLNLVNRYVLKQDEIRVIMVQILSAVTYMHNHNIFHRDLKLENVVIVQAVVKSKIMNIQTKIIDFGISMDLNKNQVNSSEYLLGTLLYMPPECMKGVISLPWDIWSCGIICYILSTGQAPYKYKFQEELIKLIEKGNFCRQHLKKLPKDLQLFLITMLEKGYRFRATAEQALKNSWLSKQQKNIIMSVSKRKQTFISFQNYEAKNNLIAMIEGYLITKKVNQSERQRLGQIFSSIDSDHSGIIQIDQLRKFYSQNSQYYDEKEVDTLLEVIDKNKSGKIDFNEFLTAMCSRRQLFQLQSLSEAFDFFDKDLSGELSREQIQGILRGVENEQVEHLFKMVDVDQNDRISKKQFLAYFQKMIHD